MCQLLHVYPFHPSQRQTCVVCIIQNRKVKFKEVQLCPSLNCNETEVSLNRLTAKSKLTPNLQWPPDMLTYQKPVTQPVQGWCFKLWNTLRSWKGNRKRPNSTQSPFLPLRVKSRIPSIPLSNTAIVLWKVCRLLGQRLSRKASTDLQLT